MDEDPSMLQAPDPEVIARLRADSAVLRDSFAAAAADPRGFAAQFYTRLFELAPAARALFPADLNAVQEKFAQTLATIVAFAEDPAALIVGLRQLGARHVAYGTQPQHYAMVGEALLWTLDRACAGGIAADQRAAWRRLYGWIVAEMLSGARAAT
jgi:hemoglobin-like flavoprotein